MKPANPAAAPEPVTVCILGREKFVDESITRLLNESGQFKVILVARDRKTAAERIRQIKPQILFVCYQFDGCLGAEFAAQLKGTNPEMRIIGYSTRHHADQVYCMLDADGHAFLTLDNSPQEYVDAVFSVAAGHYHYNQYLNVEVLQHYNMHKLRPDAHWRKKLSPDELLFATLVHQHVTRKEMPEKMGMKNRAELDNFCKRVYERHGIHKASELVSKGINTGQLI